MKARIGVSIARRSRGEAGTSPRSMKDSSSGRRAGRSSLLVKDTRPTQLARGSTTLTRRPTSPPPNFLPFPPSPRLTALLLNPPRASLPHPFPSAISTSTSTRPSPRNTRLNPFPSRLPRLARTLPSPPSASSRLRPPLPLKSFTRLDPCNSNNINSVLRSARAGLRTSLAPLRRARSAGKAPFSLPCSRCTTRLPLRPSPLLPYLRTTIIPCPCRLDRPFRRSSCLTSLSPLSATTTTATHPISLLASRLLRSPPIARLPTPTPSRFNVASEDRCPRRLMPSRVAQSRLSRACRPRSLPRGVGLLRIWQRGFTPARLRGVIGFVSCEEGLDSSAELTVFSASVGRPSARETHIRSHNGIQRVSLTSLQHFELSASTDPSSLPQPSPAPSLPAVVLSPSSPTSSVI